MGRLVRQADDAEAELAVVITDRCQEMGLGTELVRRLIEVAKCEGIRRIKAEILSENTAMVKLAKHFHFDCVRGDDVQSLTATLQLNSRRSAR